MIGETFSGLTDGKIAEMTTWFEAQAQRRTKRAQRFCGGRLARESLRMEPEGNPSRLPKRADRDALDAKAPLNA